MSMPQSPESFDDFGISEDLVQSPEHKAATVTSIDFDGLLHPPLLLHEDLANGCGGQLWPAGMTLAKYLLRKRDVLDDGAIVELGAGGGLVGLAIALGCGRQVCITDQIVMLELMQRNIKLNGLQSKVKAEVLDWGTAMPQPRVLLAADCVYFEPAFEPLQQTLRAMIGENTVCYFCFKKRRRADLHFIKQIKKDFDVAEVVDDPDKKSYNRDNVFLYTIRKRMTTWIGANNGEP